MPQVASNPLVHAPNPHLPRLARPSASSDGPVSPFESLLDESTPTPDQPAPSQPDTKAASGSDTQPVAKSTDAKPAPQNTATAVTPRDDASIQTPQETVAQATCSVKTDTNAQVADASSPHDGVKADTADKPVDDVKGDQPATTPANILQTTTPAAPAAAPIQAPTPTPSAVADAQDDQPLPQNALVQALGPQIKSMDTGIAKTGSGKQTDQSKPAEVDQQDATNQAANALTDEAPTTAKPASEKTPEKAQFAVSASDKDQIAQARGEALPNGHHAGADAPAAVSADNNAAAPNIAADTSTPPVPSATSPATPNAAALTTLAPQPGPQAAAIPLAGVAVEIAGQALAGKNRFEIRLDPPELGRIEVRLDVDRKGNVTSRLTVDRPETLDLLRRDASGLERALQDAGLKTSDNSLQFSLRDQSMNQQQPGNNADAAQIIVKDESLPSLDVVPQNYGRLAGLGSGVDIRV